MNEPVSKFDIEAARRFWFDKQATRERQRRARWAAACSDCQQITAMIKSEFRPKRILQWGSLLDVRHFSEASDIDLAVEGLDVEEFFALFRWAEDLTNFPLDLLRWENLSPEVRKLLLMKGKILHEIT